MFNKCVDLNSFKKEDYLNNQTNKKLGESSSSFNTLVSNKKPIQYGNQTNTKSEYASLEYSVQGKYSIMNNSLFNESINNDHNVHEDSFISNGPHTLNKSNNITSLSLSKSNNLDTERLFESTKTTQPQIVSNRSQISNLSNIMVVNKANLDVHLVSSRSLLNNPKQNSIMSAETEFQLRNELEVPQSNSTFEYFIKNK